MQNWRLELLSWLSGAWQFRWYGLACAWVICVVGWIGVALIPNTFESAAKVYIDTDTLLRPLLKGIAVTTDSDQQINVMLRTLLTTPNLERVVRATNPNASSMSRDQMQDAVAAIRGKVRLRNLGVKNLYSISYTDADPRYANSVAQTLLSVLVDSNLGSQRRDADDVRSFLDNQIASYEQRLEEADKRRADFKAAHVDFFSTQANGDVVAGGDVVAAQQAVAQAQSTLDDAIARRNSLAGELAATPALLDVNAPPPVIMGGTGAPPSKRLQLAQARARLDQLRTQYTDDYPDVVATKRLIVKLESELSAQPSGGDSADTQGIPNPAYLMIKGKLTDEQTEIAVDRDRLANAQSRLETIKKNAVEALAVQRQYTDLDRDYNVLHQNYEELVSRRESANISQAAGDQQSSFVFRIVDPPRKPDRPSAPNRLLLNALVLFAACGAGGALSVFLSRISGHFMTAHQLGEAFELPILGSVTKVRNAADMLRARRAAVVFVACAGLILVGYLFDLLIFHTAVAKVSGSVM